jgi:crotonobetainyl-CoA:carnitine CoA-transferase CaiB-like acyl-CoA transferase
VTHTDTRPLASRTCKPRRAGLGTCTWSRFVCVTPAIRQGLAQERYYSTWGYGDTPAPAPAEPSGRPGWLVPAIGVLAGMVALLGVLAAMLPRRARGRVRVQQAA